ncbi:MAG: tape measure protein [Bacillota bacterium]|jgi:hypothetical protein
MVTVAQAVGNSNSQLQKTIEKMEKINSINDRIISGFESWSKRLQKACGILGDIQSVWQTIRSVTDVVDNYTLMNIQLDNVIKNCEKTAEAQNKIYDAANKARTTYEVMADIVIELSKKNSRLFPAEDIGDTIRFVELIIKSMRTLGMGTEAEKAALQEMVEIMSSDSEILSKEQLKVLAEAVPAIAELMDGFSGPVSKAALFDAVIADAQRIEDKFANLPTTFAEAFAQFSNNMGRALAPAMEKLAELTDTEQFRNFINNVAEGMFMVGDIFYKVFSFIIEHFGAIVMAILALSIAALTWNLVMGYVRFAILKATLAQEGFNKAVAVCRFFTIIGVILTIVSLIIVAWQTSEKFRYAIFKIVESIANLFIGVANFITDIVNKLPLGKTKLERMEYLNFAEEMAKLPDAQSKATSTDEMLAAADISVLTPADLDKELKNMGIGTGGYSAADWAAASAAQGVNLGSTKPSGGKLDEVGKISEKVGLADKTIKELIEGIKPQCVNNIKVETPPANVNLSLNGDIRNDIDLNNFVSTLSKSLHMTISNSTTFRALR